jgi:hypothetical protein
MTFSPELYIVGNIIFVSIYIQLFSIQSTIKNKFPFQLKITISKYSLSHNNI